MMSKKGVSVISGNISPIAGEKYTYHIVDWYKDTPISERNPKNVIWELFRKRKNGKFTTTNIKKKGDSNFTFGEASIGNTYRLEGYLHQPEGGGLIITPKQSSTPKINKVELFYVDDTKGSTFSFREKLRTRAYCSNMFNKEVIFTLWEDDAKGEGHNANSKAIETLPPKKVNEEGVAAAEFTLTKALMQKTAQGETDPKKLEFYVTVEYYKNKKHASENVDINNPFPQQKPPTTSASKPAIPKAKGSPAEQKPKSKKEEKGILESVAEKGKELWDWWEATGTTNKEQQPTVQKPERKSPAIIKEVKVEKKEEGKCPNCEKEITIDEINKVLGDSEDQNYRKKIVSLLNEYINKRKGTAKELHINTCLRKAHFLSEIATETSLLEKKLTEGNTPPYYSENNIKSLWPGKYKELVKSGKLSTVASERPQKHLLNIVYGHKNGNKGGDDGWNYRGKGLIQLTGRTNYKDASNFLNKVFPEDYIDLEANYDKVAEIKYAVLSSIAFWEGKSIYRIADTAKTKESVPNVRFLVNSYDKDNARTKNILKMQLKHLKLMSVKKIR